MAPNPSSSTRQPLKLLMLHGFTQSGPLFHAKTGALIKHIQKAFPTHDVNAIYPTGPMRLILADIPGHEPSGNEDEEEQIEAWAWWRLSNTADPPLYQGMEAGLAAVAKVLSEEGPFDGVVGFSQGAALASMVAALLEPGRKEAFARFATDQGVSFPESFDPKNTLQHPPLKFALCYGGFRAPGPRYRGFFEQPPIQTPVLHVLGSLDPISETRSMALIDACAGDPETDGRVVWHPGGHFVPSQRPYLDAAVRFIREELERNAGSTDEKNEEDVNDMDVPF